MEAESIGPVAIVLIALYCAIFAGLALFGAHRYWLVYRYFRYRERVPHEAPFPDSPLKVLIQLPLYNEKYVAERLIRCVAEMQYAAGKLEIQVLDDSTDETTETVARVVSELQSKGTAIQHLRRPDRSGFKAGALEWGLTQSDAELIAIFDADFAPQPDFLLRTVGHFSDPAVGMVQARWDHLNADYGLLTQIQSLMLDGHFVIEHGSRSRTNCFFNFNGTAGIWRRTPIESAGG
ncbi:glycosyltransferase, partial [Candidatus Sumerlaeota bacterium]|nr:glycosyltransferase [Candidatus Sumerlaeota bacterium]